MLSLVAALAAAISARGAKAAAETQQDYIARLRLAGVADQAREMATLVDLAASEGDMVGLQAAERIWRRYAGETRALLEHAKEDLPDGLVENLSTAVSETSGMFVASLRAARNGATIAVATTQLGDSLGRLVEVVAWLRVEIEQRSGPR